VHPPNAPKIKEVNWYPPKAYWIKCNTNGDALGCPGLATYGGIFRDSSAATLDCFAKNLSYLCCSGKDCWGDDGYRDC
ncbi:putative ribonuclease H protein, partial [Trifolium medium]|nr:putative ribonuclease H protein [Trifolium medium]